MDREVEGRGVEKWDDASSIPDLSGAAPALFFCQLSKHGLTYPQNQVCGTEQFF